MCFCMLQFYTVKLQVKEEMNELPINIYIPYLILMASMMITAKSNISLTQQRHSLGCVSGLCRDL